MCVGAVHGGGVEMTQWCALCFLAHCADWIVIAFVRGHAARCWWGVWWGVVECGLDKFGVWRGDRASRASIEAFRTFPDDREIEQ